MSVGIRLHNIVLEADFLAQAKKEEKERRKVERGRRWERGLAMFPKLSEFIPAA
jgi:hypothetical protein